MKIQNSDVRNDVETWGFSDDQLVPWKQAGIYFTEVQARYQSILNGNWREYITQRGPASRDVRLQSPSSTQSSYDCAYRAVVGSLSGELI